METPTEETDGETVPCEVGVTLVWRPAEWYHERCLPLCRALYDVGYDVLYDDSVCSLINQVKS